MKPILVKSLTYNFSGHSVGVWIYVTWFFFFERLADWQHSGCQVTMVAAVAATSGFRRRSVFSPLYTAKPPHRHWFLWQNQSLSDPCPMFIPNILPLPLYEFIQLCMAVITHSTQAALHRLQTARRCCLGREVWLVVAQETTQKNTLSEATLDPLWLLLS